MAPGLERPVLAHVGGANQSQKAIAKALSLLLAQALDEGGPFVVHRYGSWFDQRDRGGVFVVRFDGHPAARQGGQTGRPNRRPLFSPDKPVHPTPLSSPPRRAILYPIAPPKRGHPERPRVFSARRRRGNRPPIAVTVPFRKASCWGAPTMARAGRDGRKWAPHGTGRKDVFRPHLRSGFQEVDNGQGHSRCGA
ncbi:hypothetical protein QR90_06325 [Deinococcus radiopugnans]|uniref:Uncharacterized protein n=1 Tax=Deinococcus radiopugnans TaxID=57497 RepID=A0A0A7KF70_9DEIO|nr:hypothetical protein QR90_06325 [Deinococcus radiopugnans]